MQTDKKKSGRFYLKWPWNLMVYIVLVILLRIFAVPIILLLMAWNKKQQPDGPEEGYCLQRTRTRLSSLVWGVLFLIIGLTVMVVFIGRIQADKSAWEMTDYVTLAVAAVIGVGGIISGLYEAYTGIRDALFPANSRLAKSIRAQMPYPDEAPDVRELFAMVDRDIKEHGKWFDRVAVGKEWVFGDDVTAISRIRVVFGRDEFVRRHSNRVIELYIIDDRHQVQTTNLSNANELPPLLDCLKLRAPEALFRPYREYFDYVNMPDEQWEKLLREYRMRKGQWEVEQMMDERAASHERQTMVLTRADGSVTSRVSPELLRKTLMECMQEDGEKVFLLTPSRPVAAEGKIFTELECVAGFYEEIEEVDVYFLLKQAPSEPGGSSTVGMALDTDDVKEAEAILLTWFEGKAPDLRGWQPVSLYIPYTSQTGSRQQTIPPRLFLVSSQGVGQSHSTFTIEDVQVAADGLVDGSYQQVELVLPGGYLIMRVMAGNKMDGRCTVTVSRPDSDRLRFFKTRCTHRQAAAWLMEYAGGSFRPEGKEWKDCTNTMLKT